LGEARRLAPAGPGGTTGDYLKTIDEADQLGAVRGHTRPCTYEQSARWLSIVAILMQQRRAETHGREPDSAEGKAGDILATAQDIHGWLAPVVAGETGLALEAVARVIDDFLRHIAHRSGLLQPRGEGEYGFAHRSFLEYFAACYLGAERDRLKLRATRCD
jgi:hypothetical protein